MRVAGESSHARYVRPRFTVDNHLPGLGLLDCLYCNRLCYPGSGETPRKVDSPVSNLCRIGSSHRHCDSVNKRIILVAHKRVRNDVRIRYIQNAFDQNFLDCKHFLKQRERERENVCVCVCRSLI